MSLFDMDLLEEKNKDRAIEQFGDLIAFVAAAVVVNHETERYPAESMIVNKELFLTVAQKYDMDMEISDENYEKVYDFFQKVIEENGEAADILTNWVVDEKTQKIMKELEDELDLPLLKDMGNFVQRLHNDLEAGEQSSQIEEGREIESWQRRVKEAIVENYKQAKEYVDSLTTQEAVDEHMAQYFYNEQNYIGQYWALAQYELEQEKEKDVAAYEKSKQRVTSLIKNYMIPVMVNDIMTQKISDQMISDIVGYEAEEADRQRMQDLIEQALRERFDVALEHVSVGEHPINKERQYDELLDFIGRYSDEMNDPIAKRIKAVEEEKVRKQRDDKLKEDIEELKQNLKDKIDRVLASKEGERIHQFMRNGKYLEEKEFRELQEKGVTQEGLAEFENTKAQLRDLSVDLIMSSIREAMNRGVSRINLEGLPQSKDEDEIEKLRKQIQSEVETYIHGVIVDKVQRMDVQPEKPVNFMSSEQEVNKAENSENIMSSGQEANKAENSENIMSSGQEANKEKNPQQAGVQIEDEKLQDVVENNVNKEVVNDGEDERGGFTMDELFDEDELDELGNPIIPIEEPKVNDDEVNNDNAQAEDNPEVQEVELQEQEPVDLGSRMVDIDAVEMNRNLHTLLEELQVADPFYIRSSPEFKNMKELLTTMVHNLDRKGDFLDHEELRNLTTDMERLQTLTDQYLTMKKRETNPSNNALRRMAVANRILNAAKKYATPLSGILKGDRTVGDEDKLREMLEQNRRKEEQEVEQIPQGIGKEFAQMALQARERLETYACSQRALNDRERLDAQNCIYLLISNRLIQMQSKKSGNQNLEAEIPKIMSEVRQIREFNVDEYTKDPKHIAEFLNNHMENKMIKDYIAELAQIQAQVKVRENDGPVRAHDDPQLHHQESVSEKVK